MNNLFNFSGYQKINYNNIMPFNIKRLLLVLCFINIIFLFYIISYNNIYSNNNCYVQQQSNVVNSNNNNNINNNNNNNNLLYNHNFEFNAVGWREYGRYFRLGYFPVPSPESEPSRHVVAIYHSNNQQWNGLFQPVDLRRHTSFHGMGYYELRLDVDYINLNLNGSLNLKMRINTRENEPQDLNDTNNVFTVFNDNGNGHHLLPDLNGGVPIDVKDNITTFLDMHQNDMDSITSRASLVMYSKKPLNYVTCYIYTELTGVALITNTSFTVTHVNDKLTPSVTMNLPRFEGQNITKVSEKIGEEFKMRDLTWEKRIVTPFYKRSTYHFDRHTDTTITAQLDITRFPRLLQLCRQWDGPMSVVIYIKEEKDVRELDRMIFENWEIAKLMDKADVHLAYKTKDERFYPINELRNVAIEFSRTNYIFTIDVDFVVSPNLNNHIREQLHEANYPTNIFFVVPAMEMDGYAMNNTDIFPMNKSSLVQHIKDGEARSILELVSPEVQGPTKVDVWVNSTKAYDVKYGPHWEPFGVIHRSAIGFDQRFAGYGWDKVSHIYYLHLLEFRFMVLPEAYMIHMEHATRSSWFNRSAAEEEYIFKNWYESVTEFTFKYLPSLFNPTDLKKVSTLVHDNDWLV
ncbi:hypothetical protein SAMD00019534_122850, partial [Acytostelium subglobosum LB1]|uniref:hypothetical protein n=1 Tax=Acytostelium subglobosum LB1 TaxID=1410327 RepID=UPI0006450468